MIFRKIKEVQNHNSYSYSTFDSELIDGYLAYFDNNSVFRIISLDNWKVLFEKDYRSPLSINYCKGFFLIEENRIIHAVNLEGGKIEAYYTSDLLEGYEISTSVVSPGVIIESQTKYENYSISERKSKLIDVESNTELYSWGTIHDLIDLDNSLAYLQPRNGGELICRDIRTTEEKWLVNLDNGAQGKRIFGKSASAIFVQRVVVKSSHFNVVALDKSKGSIIWELEDAFSFYNYDESSCKLYGLSGRTFEMIDADTGEREIQKELSENLHITPHLTYYDNGLLYFSGYRDKNIPVFGAVDVKDGSVVFTQGVQMPGEKSFRKGLDKPIIVGNRLYVRDAMKTLHVYERESHPA